MAVTRLKRKGLRNKARAKQRQVDIKKLTLMPPIKNVDVDEIKEEFAQKSGKPVSKKVEETTPEKITSKPSDKKDTPSGEPAPAKKASQTEEPQAEKTSEKETAHAPVVENPVADTDTTAELKEPAKGSVKDAEMMEEVVEEADKKEDTKLEVAPDVVSPEAGAPDETPSEANDSKGEEKK